MQGPLRVEADENSAHSRFDINGNPNHIRKEIPITSERSGTLVQLKVAEGGDGRVVAVLEF